MSITLRLSLLALLIALAVPTGAHALRVMTASPNVSPATPASMRGVLYDESFSVRAGDVLEVDLSTEHLIVRTGTGTRGRVIVEGVGRDAAQEFQRRQFSAHIAPDSFVVGTHHPRNNWSRGRRVDASFTVTVEIPRRFSAHVGVGSGNVRMASLEGDLTVNVGSGNVDLEDVTGQRVHVSTGSGNILAGDLRGDVRLRSGSGHISVARADGPLRADTGSGNVHVGSASRSAYLDSGSGNVDVVLLSDSASSIGSGSGTLTVQVPRSSNFDLDAEGASVHIDRALGFSGDRERDIARGRIGRGGSDLRLSARSGTVRLTTD